MKVWKVLPVLILLGSLLLSACSGADLAQVATAVKSAVAPAAEAVNSVPLPVLAPAAAAVSTPVVSSAPVTVSSDAFSLQAAYEAIYEQVNPLVVNIEISAYQQVVNPFRGRGQSGANSQGELVVIGEGSGFIWDSSGHIVTNNHVVSDADRIMVYFADGTAAEAKLVGADPSSDLAVIKVNVPGKTFTPIQLADSSKVKVGQLVAAIGSPFGEEGSMSTGIVSALSRTIPVSSSGGTSASSYSIPDVIQTDAAINPGNSGGVLVDLNGRLIGVTTAINTTSGSNAGVGFAIPSNIVAKVVPELISKGTYAHAYLGISGGTLTADIAAALNLKEGTRGVLVSTVTANGPAAKAGLKAATFSGQSSLPTSADVITRIDNTALTRFEDLVSYLFNNTTPGQTVTLTVLRDGKEQTFQVVLGTQPRA